MNTELLARVRDRIAQEGEEHFGMGDWVVATNGVDEIAVEKDGFTIALCTTSMCIGGWAIHESDEQAVLMGHGAEPIGSVARELLELTVEQAAVLFYKDKWPDRFLYDDDGAEIPEVEGALELIDEVLKNGPGVLNRRYGSAE